MSARRIFLPLIVALLLLAAALAGVAWLPVRHARDAWRAGRNADAISEAQRWMQLRIWSRQYHQLLAAAYLTSGNRAAAQTHLDALRGGRTWLSVLPKSEVANRLFARGAYDDFLLYDSASPERGEGEDVELYRAAAQLAANRVSAAEETMRGIERGEVEAEKLEALQRGVEQRKQGSYPFALDRDGKVIASYQIANRDVVAVNTDFEPFIERSAGGLTLEAHAERIGTNATLETTLDSAVQKAALGALSGFRSSLVAIDPRTSEILAIASNAGNGRRANLAIEQSYEPGSVVKVLTSLSAITAGVNVPGMFPYQCGGALPIDGRSFGDWRPGGHGSLKDFEEAMAQSCNVVFADLGIRAGVDRLRRTHTAAGFDSQTNLGLFQAPMGKTAGQIFNKFETGFYSIGLEHETITTLHLAMLASMMANRGTLTTPLIFRTRRSILGESLGEPPKQERAQVASREVAERVVAAMRAVVERPEGTGRRAAVEGLTLAMKTGTAGKEERGYHALVMAFAPVESPRIAFAVIAEESGPAEFAAAKIVHDFLRGIEGRLK